MQTLVPRIIGQTEEAQQKKATSSSRKWTEDSFFEELSQRRTPEEVVTTRKILEWARPKATRIWWGQGGKTGSFTPILRHKDRDQQFFTIYTYGKVEIIFQIYMKKPPFDSEDKRQQLLTRLNSFLPDTIPADLITKRPSIPLALLKTDILEKFLKTFDWFVEEVKTS